MIAPHFARIRRRAVPTALAAFALAAAGAGACGAADKTSGAGVPKTPSAVRDEKLEHESCDVSGSHVEALDTNNDGKPDIRRVYDGSGHEKCRTVDLNHDGRTDLYEYFDATGAVRRRELCYDDTGAVNAIESYEGGKLARREYDTTGQHKIDTWDWFDPNAAIDPKTGRPVHPLRRERDTKGGGYVDQWWTWEGAKVSIATDRDGDGQPDPASVIVLGGGDDAGPPVPAAADAASPVPAPAGDAGPGEGASGEGGAP